MQSIAEQLFSFCAQSHNLALAKALAMQSAATRTLNGLPAAFDRAAEVCEGSCEELVQALFSVKEDSVLRSFLCYWYLILNAEKLSAAQLRGLKGALVPILEKDSFEIELAHILMLGKLSAETPLSTIRRELLSFRSQLQSRTGLQSIFLRALVELTLGNADERMGNYRAAKRHLETARSLAKDNSFLLVLSAVQQLGSLYWASGLFERAIEYHQAPEFRALAEMCERRNWLARSHLALARCAIDLQRLELARAELAKVDTLISEQTLTPLTRGTALFFASQLKGAEGEIAASQTLAEQALALFASKPLRHLALDAELWLAQLSYRQGDRDRFINESNRILEEALKLDAQRLVDRTLFLQSFVLPIVDWQSMRNPALRMKTLANMLWSARRRGKVNAMQTILDHIESLESLMIEASYELIYDQGVRRPFRLAV